jgi:GNAT superfamily N-acetyltransferase
MTVSLVTLSDVQITDIDDRLEAFDDAHFGERPDGELNLGLQDDEGQLVAGVVAEMTAFRILYVSTLWVDEQYRRHGYGTQLLKAVELRALDLGATAIRLDTFDWQGVEFYRTLGYEEVGKYLMIDEGYSEHFFLKRLTTSAQS